MGHVEEAVRIWQGLQKDNSAYAYVELAKYYEHRQRDYLAAAKLVYELLALDQLPPKGECSRQALEHRLSRLDRKLGKGGLPMPQIESYSFGKISVDGKTYTSDLIILPSGVRSGWWRKEGHRLDQADLQSVVGAKPNVLVIGTGNLGLMKVPKETLEFITAHEIRAVVKRTAAACLRYNELVETERVAAALHLTC